MNRDQQRFLLNRLDEARRGKPSRYDEVEGEIPDHVKAAQDSMDKANKVIASWRIRRDRERKTRNNKIEQAFNKAKTKVLFATTAEAIKAIEEFEKKAF